MAYVPIYHDSYMAYVPIYNVLRFSKVKSYLRKLAFLHKCAVLGMTPPLPFWILDEKSRSVCIFMDYPLVT